MNGDPNRTTNPETFGVDGGRMIAVALDIGPEELDQVYTMLVPWDEPEIVLVPGDPEGEVRSYGA